PRARSGAARRTASSRDWFGFAQRRRAAKIRTSASLRLCANFFVATGAFTSALERLARELLDLRLGRLADHGDGIVDAGGALDAVLEDVRREHLEIARAHVVA